MDFNACHDKAECVGVHGEGLNFQLVRGPQKLSFRPTLNEFTSQFEWKAREREVMISAGF